MSQNPADPQPSWRKPAGMFLILTLIAVWTVIVVSVSPWVGTWPVLVQAIFLSCRGDHLDPAAEAAAAVDGVGEMARLKRRAIFRYSSDGMVPRRGGHSVRKWKEWRE